ncbi:hypothetical protein ACR42D_10100 [Desulfovibrio caledoniensis]
MMWKFVLVLVLALMMAGCASRQQLRNTCLGSKQIFIDNEEPSMDDVNLILDYCRHAIDANPGDEELIKAYNEMYLQFYNEDGTVK